MADPILELDAAGSNVDGSNPGTSMLLVDAANGWGLTSFDAPSPELKLLWTSNVDMDGALRADPGQYENRTITAQLDCALSTAALTQAQLRILGHKIGKIAREGGTLKVTYPSGNTFIFDLVAGSHNIQFDETFVLANLAQVTVTFTALPGARGAEQDLGDNVETTLPALVFTEASIPGDLSALGRLVIDNDASVDQWWLLWGFESRYYSASANAALFYEAEGRSLMGASSLQVGPTGASGAGSNTIRNTAIGSDWKAIMSTQATGAGAHLSHVGTFRVFARVQPWGLSANPMQFALDWSQGDFLNVTRNPTVSVTIPGTSQAKWVLLDLGLVRLRPVISGTQRWEGRLVVRGGQLGTDDTVSIDYLMFVPAAEGSGIASGVQSSMAAATSYVAEDHFASTTAGSALNTRVAPTGGTWATSGDATDFVFNDPGGDATSEGITRTAVSGTNGRFAILGSTNYVNAEASVRVYYSGLSSGQVLNQGVILRWVDSSNYLRAFFSRENTGSGIDHILYLQQVVGGAVTELGNDTLPLMLASSDMYWKVVLSANAAGQATASVIADDIDISVPAIGTVSFTCSGSSAALATGGTLATGKPGIWDVVASAGTSSRWYDDFLVSSTTPDAVAFANQSVEIRHDRAQREDSTGTLWTPISSYVGDYLKVPPSGAESRSTRAIVKMARNDPSTLDSAIDDLSARLFVTPRYLQVPSA